MPLQKAHATIPLGASLATGIDDKLLQPGNTLELVNCRQGRLGEVIARDGVSALGTGLMGSGGVLRAPWALATLNDALVSFAGVGDNPAAIYSPTANQWGADTGTTAGAVTTQRRGPIFASRSSVTNAGFSGEVAYGSGYYFVTYFSTDNVAGTLDIYEIVIDSTSKSVVASHKFNDGLTLGTTLLGVRFVNGYGVFYRSTTASDIAFDAWQVSNLDAGPVTTVHATSTSLTGQHWDAIINGTSISLVYQDSAQNASGVDFAPATATLTAWAPQDAAAASIPVNNGLNWFVDLGSSGKLALVSGGNLAGIRAHWNIPASGATRAAATTTTVDVTALGRASSAIAYTNGSSAAGTFVVLYGGASELRLASYVAGVASTTATSFGINIGSKVWTYGGDYFFMGATAPVSKTQNTKFVMRIGPTLVITVAAKTQVNGVGADTTGQATQLNSFPATPSPSSGTFLTTGTFVLGAAAQTGVLVQQLSVDLLTVTHKSAGDTTYGVPKEALGSLFVPGGTLGRFDGKVYAEAGFSQFPDQLVLAPGAGGNLTISSTYYYEVVYRFDDANARRWRSAPSVQQSVALSAAQNRVTLTIPMLLIADVQMTIEIYRGAANSTGPMQLVGTVANATTGIATFVDDLADTATAPLPSQAAGEFIYTTGGGVLENDPIPGMSSLAVAGNRLFGVSMDEPDAIWPSAPFAPGIGLRFSETTKFYIRDDHGPITGLAALPNGVVIAFKGDAIYAITGDGPDAAGRGSFRTDFVAIGLGSTNPRSIVETSAGCEFLSTSTKAGWWQINAGLNPVYIGGPVERYIDKTIVGAVLVPSKNETRYYTDSNDGGSVRALVHNLVTGLWNVDVSPDDFGDITCAAAYGGGAAYGALGPVGVHVDAPSTWADIGINYDSAITTPWIRFGDLKGYERFYRVQGVGERATGAGTHTLSISMQRNFITTSVLASVSVAPGVLWDWEFRYSAKFESARFVIGWTPNAGPQIKATALVVEYGVKQGMGKYPASKRAT